MIKSNILYVCMVVVLQHAISCQAYMYLEPVKFGEGECFDDNWNVHPVGSVWYDREKCERLKCIFSRGILYIRTHGCSAIGYSQECWLVPGKGKKYPKCCPQVECLNLEVLPQ